MRLSLCDYLFQYFLPISLNDLDYNFWKNMWKKLGTVDKSSRLPSRSNLSKD